MRYTTICLAVLIILCGPVLPHAIAQEAAETPPEGLKLMRNLPHDPVLVWVQTLEDPAQSFDEMAGWIARFSDDAESSQISAKLAEADAKLGFSLRDDLLANLGPEFAVAIDFPPIDQVAAAFSSPQAGLETLLGRLGVLVTVRDRETIDRCLRRLVELAEGRVSQADDLIRVDLGPEGEQETPEEMSAPSLFYGFRGTALALGASDDWVRDALDADTGPGLRESDDFKKVFSQLDASPSSLIYVNLPRLAEMIRSSGVVQAMIQAEPEASRAAELFLSPDFVGMGLGSTSVELEGGVRTTTFGPSALAGGSLTPGIIAAIAIPNLLNAIDRGKQKRSMADLRSVGTACESFAIDNESYPGPTEGWVELSVVADELEPIYIRSLPKLDGWDNPFLYWSDGTSYRIVSRGKDGAEDRDWSDLDPEQVTAAQEFNHDIVFANGMFVVYPEGQQQ